MRLRVIGDIFNNNHNTVLWAVWHRLVSRHMHRERGESVIWMMRMEDGFSSRWCEWGAAAGVGSCLCISRCSAVRTDETDQLAVCTSLATWSQLELEVESRQRLEQQASKSTQVDDLYRFNVLIRVRVRFTTRLDYCNSLLQSNKRAHSKYM